MNDKIRFDCPSCGKSVAVKAEAAGKKGKCKRCGEMMLVPHQTEILPVPEYAAPVQQQMQPVHQQMQPAQSADHMTNIVINQQQARQSQALPALASFFLPGLGQIIQGRTMVGIAWMVGLFFAALSMFIVIGFLLYPVGYLLCIVDAAKYNPR